MTHYTLQRYEQDQLFLARADALIKQFSLPADKSSFVNCTHALMEKRWLLYDVYGWGARINHADTPQLNRIFLNTRQQAQKDIMRYGRVLDLVAQAPANALDTRPDLVERIRNLWGAMGKRDRPRIAYALAPYLPRTAPPAIEQQPEPMQQSLFTIVPHDPYDGLDGSVSVQIARSRKR